MAASWQLLSGGYRDTIFSRTSGVCWDTLGHFRIKNAPRKIKERKEHHQSKTWDYRHEIQGYPKGSQRDGRVWHPDPDEVVDGLLIGEILS